MRSTPAHIGTEPVRRSGAHGWPLLVQAAVFPALGGVAMALWLGDWRAGVAAYYALLLLAILSPEGRPLRRALLPRRRD